MCITFGASPPLLPIADIRRRISIAEEVYERLISLPMFHGMNDQDVDDVIEAMKKVVGSYS
jgi:dTDP-4-amino-4,6-dideoxygalactose transaminase